MRNCSLFNNDWLYSADRLDLEAGDEQFESITIPHTNKIFPHNNFDNRDYQFISTYRKRFHHSSPDEKQLVFLEFDGVMLASTVHLNGEKVGQNLGGYAPFSVNITEALQDGENVLTVYVDSRERKDIPPYGHLVDYLTFGGIYRDVHLTRVNPIFVENIFIQTANVLDDPQLSCVVRLNHVIPKLKLGAVLLDNLGNPLAETHGLVEEETTSLNFASLPEINLWSLDNPVLYTIKVSLSLDGKAIDDASSRFGFREAIFRPDGGFYLNGQHVKLFGLDRHQTYPYIGAAAPARLQRLDADTLKYELACNIVRTSHYP
jgi:beta-galactosidase